MGCLIRTPSPVEEEYQMDALNLVGTTWKSCPVIRYSFSDTLVLPYCVTQYKYVVDVSHDRFYLPSHHQDLYSLSSCALFLGTVNIGGSTFSGGVQFF